MSCAETLMTYDGYGRLKTKHVPEQNAGTATVYAYKDDDTIEKVTDARGASATYVYNNGRHLVNEINYFAPSGITPTPEVTFGYDAAGNRTGMTDGLGSVSYGYNQLSQMTSETRTLTGVGSYTLGYDYNLAGALKTFTSPFGETLNYGFDSTGRLQNINGSGYYVSQFLNSAQYRAWGTLKSATYGNGITESAGYNSRMQMTSRQVQNSYNTVGASSTYQYYADGGLRFSQSLDDRFDRAFSYDHAARVTEAFSGSQARDFISGGNSGTPTGPYRQSYQYSSFNQVTQQTNRLWSQTETASNTFVDNRLQGWSYDAAGALASDGLINYGHDAAGRLVRAGNSGGADVNGYDGDGRLTRIGVQLPSGGETNPGYYLHSSVIGLAVAKLYSNGSHRESYVYAGGKKIATTTPWQTLWTHQDPVTGSHGISSTTGFYWADGEFTSDGLNVGLAEPTSPPPDFPEFKFPVVANDGGCSVGNPTCVTCYLDGLRANCATVRERIQHDAARQCPDNDCGPRTVYNPQTRQGELQTVRWDPNTGQLGYRTWELRFNPPLGEDEAGITRFGTSFWAEVWHYSAAPTVGFIGSGFQPQKPGEAVRSAMHAVMYEKCKGLADIPSKAASLILEASRQEGTDPTLIAVSMKNESSFGRNLKPNPRYEDGKFTGYHDVGWMQIANDPAIWNQAPYTDDLPDAYGWWVSQVVDFNGDPLQNVRLGARALNASSGWKKRPKNVSPRADAAGIYRAGSRGPASYGIRVKEFERDEKRYDQFFKCMRGQ